MNVRRAVLSAPGVSIVAVGVGMLRFAAYGVDPFTVLMTGLDQMIPLSYGTVYVAVNAVMLLFSLAADRKYIGLGTLLNLFFTGYIAEFTLELLRGAAPEASPGLRFCVLICSIAVLCLGSSFYITADMGVSAYDAVALVLANKWKIWKFKYLRICTDFVCVAAGIALFLLGGGAIGQIPAFVGIGSVITAFFMGPTIDFFNRHLARWLLGNSLRQSEGSNKS